jgi:hypothetical protein
MGFEGQGYLSQRKNKGCGKRGGIDPALLARASGRGGYAQLRHAWVPGVGVDLAPEGIEGAIRVSLLALPKWFPPFV